MSTRIFLRFRIVDTAKAYIKLAIFTWANHPRPLLHLAKHTFKTQSFIHQKFVLIRTTNSFTLKTLIANVIMTCLYRTTDPFAWVLLLPTIITNSFGLFVLDITVMIVIAKWLICSALVFTSIADVIITSHTANETNVFIPAFLAEMAF